MSIQLIALDLDRTTLDGQSRLSPRNRRALEAAIAAGVYVVVASGRSLNSLPREVVELPGLEYAVTCNGAAIHSLTTGECLLRRRIPAGAVREILTRTAGEPVTYEGFLEGRAYGSADYLRHPERYDASPRSVAYVKSTRTPVEDIRAFLLEQEGKLDGMDVVVKDETEQRRVWGLLEGVEGIYLTSSAPQLVEIAHREAGKHRSVAWLTRHLGLAPEQVAAFGDGDNDAELLRFAGLGVAVANASHACRAAADYVTGHHAEDGVGQAIEKILDGTLP